MWPHVVAAAFVSKGCGTSVAKPAGMSLGRHFFPGGPGGARPWGIYPSPVSAHD